MTQLSLAARFWEKVEVRGAHECWEWKAARFDNDYGAFQLGLRRTGRAHRVAWELARGPIPSGFWVLHHCDNRPCVNPRHLYIGTVLENARDREQRGRGRRPVPTPRKLTPHQVVRVRTRHARGESARAIALSVGMDPSHISRVVRGVAWPSVQEASA